MPLTPEQQQRIVEEERQRVEEEFFRQKVRQEYLQQLTRELHDRDQQPRPPRRRRRFHLPRRVPHSNPMLWVYVGCLVILSLVVARQFGWFRKHQPSAQAQQLTIPPVSPQTRAVFGPAAAESPSANPKQRPQVQLEKPATTTTTARRLPPDDSARNREPEPPAQASAPVPPGIASLLDRWTDTVANPNPQLQAACYAPVADVYFNHRHVPNSEIEADKRKMLTTYPHIGKYQISNIRVTELSSNRAVLTLVKDWDVSGSGRFAGSEQEQLTLGKFGNEWKITGERETHVFWRLKQQ